MYDELVKKLRRCGKGLCTEDCPDWTKNNLYHTCQDEVVLEAADAIEEQTGFVQEAERDRDEYRERLDKANDAIDELDTLLDGLEADNDALCETIERLQKPRWIPVTEKLPEDRSDVLAYLKYELGGRIAAANYDKGWWQDCVMGSLYRTEEGVVTHWMPLPQPPKEET